MSKIKIIHFHNGSGGGVLSVITNLLKFSENQEIENHVIFTINKDLVAKYEMPVLEGASTQQVFYYSAHWNFYYTCRQLAKLLPDQEAVVVAHDWLELGMMSNLGLQNPVIQIVHGNYDYYYELAHKNSAAIDQFICISPVIYKELVCELPNRETSIKYCRFPVPVVQAIEKESQALKIFYCVRSLNDENKQFHLLPKINALLKAKKIFVHWTIVGQGIMQEEVEIVMDQYIDLNVFPLLTNDEVLAKLIGQDIFILPSLQEGFPVAVVEAMKAGLIPLVTNWDGATEQLIIQGETGFYVEPGNAVGYAEHIEFLNKSRTILKMIRTSAMQKANELFEPFQNTKIIEFVFLKVGKKYGSKKKALKVYGSRLDAPWLNNTLTSLIRTFSK